MRPSIDGTAFGSITIAGERYEHDVVIGLDGGVWNTATGAVIGMFHVTC